MAKLNALQKIESHEKLCRIMQKLTHKKIHQIEERVKRLEKILLSCTGALIASMAYLIYTLVSHIKQLLEICLKDIWMKCHQKRKVI